MAAGPITTVGKTVQEALEKALRKLDAKEDQVNIEVLQQPHKGFLGFAAKPARIRVTLKEEFAQQFELDEVLTDLGVSFPSIEETRTSETPADSGMTGGVEPGEPDKQLGTASVTDGRLIITNPSEGLKQALLKAGSQVELKVNVEKIEGEIAVSEEDKVEITVLNESPQADLEISLSRDKVEASMRLMTNPGVKYRLRDQPPSNRLTLTTEIEDVLEPPIPTVEEALEKLQKKNITAGVIRGAIEEALNDPNSKELFQVAIGQRPVDGKNAYFTYPFLQDKGKKEVGIFGHDRLKSVNEGDLLAVKVPKEEGQDGWTVTGEELPAKKPLDCEMLAKNGVELIEGGNRAIATISGRPVIEAIGNNASIHVDPIYIVEEVNQSTGNIKFTGDVEVRGEVRDGCTVQADGNVEVLGNVTGSSIKAGSSVLVHKMIFGSTVLAGGRTALYSAMLPQLKELLEQLRDMLSTVKQSRGDQAEDIGGEGRLLQTLVDSEYEIVPRLIKDLVTSALESGITVHEDFLRLLSSLNNSMCGLGPLRYGSIGQLHRYCTDLDEFIVFIENSIKKVEYIKARYVQNSNLICSGDILVEGQGCYISSIDAGGKILITGKPGIARGVQLTAAGDITVRELGSGFDTQTAVKIRDNGKVSAEIIHPNVTVKIDKEKFRAIKKGRSFTAQLNSEGHLETSMLSGDTE